MKKLLTLVLLSLFTLEGYSQTVNISLEYGGLLTDTNSQTPVTDLEIGSEFYVDVIVENTDNSLYKVSYASIWFTFKNNAFEYLGVENPLEGQNNWYTNQWPSEYVFNTSSSYPPDDLEGQYKASSWSFVGNENSLHAPLVISSQTSVELTGVVARLKFKYKQVSPGFDFEESVMLRKARVLDNSVGHTFQDVKAHPNQTFDNVPPSTAITASFSLLLPSTLNPQNFEGGLYYYNSTTDTWVQPEGALYGTLSSTGTLDITEGFNNSDNLSVILNWSSSASVPFSEQYQEIVTISDVALAFLELNDRGINQDEVGNNFVKGIQFLNADVTQNGIFDSDDTYFMLAQIFGTETYLSGDGMVYASMLYSKQDYDLITKNNYSDFSQGTTLMVPINNVSTGEAQYIFEGAITWLGDVNLSHSTEPVSGGSKKSFSSFVPSYVKAFNQEERQISSSLTTSLVNGKVVAKITLNPFQQSVIGTQYKVRFDKNKLSLSDINFKTNNTSTNFSNLVGDYINLGSLVQIKNNYLDDTTTYTLTFTPNIQLSNTLGLVTLVMTDAVNTKGEQLKIILE